MSDLIVLANVTKRFGGLTAVDDLSFSIKSGEAIALWGANGAGKTTALRCLLGLLPFEGKVTIDGIDITRHGKAARAKLGFVPQELNFHDDMTVAETITFYARLKKIPSGQSFTELLERLDIMPHISKRVRNLSGGLKQRLALALALLADPPILVLDEPTANLDISAREDFLTLLQTLKSKGKTLVFSSHRLEEVVALSDRVLLMEAGRLVADGPPSEMERRRGWETTLYLSLPEGEIETAVSALIAQGLFTSRNGRGIRVQIKPGDKGLVLQILAGAGIEIKDFTVE